MSNAGIPAIPPRTSLQTRSAGRVLWRLAARREYGLAIVILLIVGAVSVRNFHFLALDNLGDVLTACTQPAIVACGVMLVIVTGEIDISVGGSLGLLAAVMGWMVSPTHWGWPPWLGVLAVLALGTCIGLINGVLVTLVRVPSIIVTLAMMTMLRGVTVLLMKPGDITDMPAAARFFGIGKLFGVPANLLVTVGVIAITGLLIRQMPIGRRIFAVGSNTHAAALSGLSVVRTKIFVFMFTGFVVGVAALVTRLATVTSGVAPSFELLVVTCVVVGGVSISGGKGTLTGVMLGVLLLSIQKPALIFLHPVKDAAYAAYWEKAIQGGLILVAVLVDHLAAGRAGVKGGHG